MSSFIKNITTKYTTFQIILFAGVFFRLLAALFSKGFGWADDHFLIIEPANCWANGFDDSWLPSAEHPDRTPLGHPLSYTGTSYLIFKLMSLLGIVDPQIKMIFIRLFHVFWSIPIIVYGYKIAKHYSSEKTANLVAGFLSLFWFMPFLSVRNLAEFVCIPPLLIATWLIIENRSFRSYLYAGLWFGVAFSFRFQSIIYMSGFGIALLIMRTSIPKMLSVLFGFGIIFMITEGAISYALWGRPFAEFLEYINYNLTVGKTYGVNIWYMYPSLLLGLTIPPLSIIIFAGYFYCYKKLPILFWPALMYLAFHLYFPNKQERFVLTMVPTYMIAGTIGAMDLYARYKHKFKLSWIKGSAYFVITLNFVLVFFFIFHYGKRQLCESMYYLYEQKDMKNFMVEDGNRDEGFTQPPQFYCGKYISIYGINKIHNADSAVVYYNGQPPENRPNYVVFFERDNLETRVGELKKRFPSLTYKTTILPGLIDRTITWLNPVNNNMMATIYKIE